MAESSTTLGIWIPDKSGRTTHHNACPCADGAPLYLCECAKYKKPLVVPKANPRIFKYKLDPTVGIPYCSMCEGKAIQQTINVDKRNTNEYCTYQCERHK